MDEGTFIVIALAICLALLASLYFGIDRLGDRVLTLAAQAPAREQSDIINHERLARTVNELVDETTVLTETLKNERITHIVDQFRRAVEQRQPSRLVVNEHGRQIGRVVIEIAIEGTRR